MHIEQFLINIPLLALLLVSLLLPVAVWVYSRCLVRQPKKNRKLLLFNAGIALLSLAIMAVALHFVDLPSSLLPKNNILELSCYSREFTQAFTVLETFAAEGDHAARELLNVASASFKAFRGIVGGGGLIALLTVLIESTAVSRREKRARKEV